MHSNENSHIIKHKPKNASLTLLPTPSTRIYKDKRNDKNKEKDKDGSSSNESYSDHGMGLQEHARVRRRIKIDASETTTNSSSLSTASEGSVSPDVSRFRCDFEEMKCKVRVFGESLSLCKCIAQDFKLKFYKMEKRLEVLERKQKHKVWRTESNYSQIIHKNKKLSTKAIQDVKKLQMCGTEAEMREVAARICRNYLHGAWKTVDSADLEFKRISGGLSNFLYYVALPEQSGKLRGFATLEQAEAEAEEGADERRNSNRNIRCNSFTLTDEPKQVLLRIYGQVHGERAMDAIVTESVIFTLLSERRLGPKLHGVFSGGRIEEFIPARPLLTRELSEPALSMKIAEKMAAIHSMDVPLSKGAHWLWKTITKWMKTISDENLELSHAGKFQNPEQEVAMKKLKDTDFQKEIDWLKKFIDSVDSLVVFCHNDMQEGNILMLEDVVQTTAEDDLSSSYVPSYNSMNSKVTMTRDSFEQFDESNTSDSVSSHISDSGEPKLVLIDFEYCAYNYRGFDLANHFAEWCYDYTNPKYPFYYEFNENYPTLEQKEIFIKEYLKHYNSNVSEEKDQVAPTIDEINHLLHEVEAFALASHLFWCLWSIVNASKSQIPFGYWEYAVSRLETYLRLKQEMIKKEKFGFPQKRKICEVDI